MKKQIQILAATFITVAFISCSKQEMPVQQQMPAEEQTTPNKPGEPITIDPLSVKLEGWFKFNNNLKDATGKLADGVSIGGPAKFITDRKGNRYSALKPDGSFQVRILNVPQLTNHSISVWVKTADMAQNKGIVSGNEHGLFVVQNPDKYVGGLKLVPPGGISVTTALPTDIVNNGWHHLAVTYDGNAMKFYFDGALTGTTNLPGGIDNSLVDYLVANGFWKGAVDDLRFYRRTLSATEVQKLFIL